MKRDEHNFKVYALKFFQNEEAGKAIFVGKIKVELLNKFEDRFKIDLFKRKNGEDSGYQRDPYQDSIDKFQEYIINQSPSPIVPTTITVNAREPITFKRIHPTIEDFVEIEIDQTLYIIDGQHRTIGWIGLLHEPNYIKKWKDYEIPIIILSGFDYHREVELFYVMNDKQRRIKTDLALRLLLKLAKNEETSRIIPKNSKWQNIATVITDALNESVDNIWKNKIIIAGDSKELRRSKIIGQNSFVQSLKHFFTQQEPLFNLESLERQEIHEDEWIELLASFWNIVGKVYPLCVKSPREYSLMKTVGVYSLHYLLNNIAKENGGIKNKTKILEIANEKIMKASDEVNGRYKTEFWRSRVEKNTRERGRYGGAYSSHQGHVRLAQGVYFNTEV